MEPPIRLLAQGWAYFRNHTLQETLAAILSRNAHPLVQFGKYGFCGVMAVGTQVGFFALFSHWWPSHQESGLTNELRSNHHMLANLLAFPFSNVVAYFTNRFFVFTPGRHSPGKEFLLFTGISLLSFSVGLAAGPYLIRHYGIGKWAAEGSFAVTSAMVNFVCRKFLVFAK